MEHVGAMGRCSLDNSVAVSLAVDFSHRQGKAKRSSQIIGLGTVSRTVSAGVGRLALKKGAYAFSAPSLKMIHRLPMSCPQLTAKQWHDARKGQMRMSILTK